MPRALLHNLLIILTIVLLGAAAFAPAIGFPLINYDDPELVSDNPQVLEGLSAANFRWAWTTLRHANYMPMTWMSLQLDSSFGPARPWRYHLTNILLHLLNGVLLFLTLKMATSDRWRSAAAALLFTVHPLRVESVVWVTERKDVLACAFALLAMLLYLRYVRRKSSIDYVLLVVCFALSLLSKMMAVTLPCVLLLLDYWPLQRWQQRGERWQPLIEKLPLFAVVVIFSIAALFAQKSGGAIHGSDLPLGFRLANADVSYWRYLLRMVAFDRLAVFYPYTDGFSNAQAVLGFLGLLIVSLLVLLRLKAAPWLAVGWFWFLGAMVPMLQLVQLGDQAMADRFTYFPCIGLLIMLVWSIPAPPRHNEPAKLAIAVAAAAVFIYLFIFTRIQVSYWRDDQTLFAQAAKVTRNNYIAYGQLGNLAQQRGDLAQAADYYSKALDANPGDDRAHANWGIMLVAARDLPGAEAEFRAALRLNDADAANHLNLGVLLLRTGRPADAVAELQKAAAIRPDDPRVQAKLAEAQAAAGFGRPGGN